jgi:hypothetical protein
MLAAAKIKMRHLLAAALGAVCVDAQLTDQWETLELCYVDASWKCVRPVPALVHISLRPRA